jgi:hypothetical protein
MCIGCGGGSVLPPAVVLRAPANCCCCIPLLPAAAAAVVECDHASSVYSVSIVQGELEVELSTDTLALKLLAATHTISCSSSVFAYNACNRYPDLQLLLLLYSTTT